MEWANGEFGDGWPFIRFLLGLVENGQWPGIGNRRCNGVGGENGQINGQITDALSNREFQNTVFSLIS